jgi:uncharacterized protein YodC (DUF2158 family)
MQTKSEFKVGDIVVLKSGGPKMTVSEVHIDRIATTWFAGSKKESSNFPPEPLRCQLFRPAGMRRS